MFVHTDDDAVNYKMGITCVLKSSPMTTTDAIQQPFCNLMYRDFHDVAEISENHDNHMDQPLSRSRRILPTDWSM